MTSSTRRSRYSALLALNGVALAALTLVSFAPGAAAQNQGKPGGTARGRGDYTMVSAKIQGMLENAVFICDAGNSELLAIRWDGGRKAIVGLGHRDLAADARKPGTKGR